MLMILVRIKLPRRCRQKN